MAKVKDNFTLDSDLSDKLNKFNNKSEKVNEILRKHFDEIKDPYEELRMVQGKQWSLDKEHEKWVNEIKRIAEDGDRQARDRANKELQQLELKEQLETEKAKKYLNSIIKNKHFKEFVQLPSWDIKFLIDMARKMTETGSPIGAVELQLIIKKGLLEEKGLSNKKLPEVFA